MNLSKMFLIFVAILCLFDAGFCLLHGQNVCQDELTGKLLCCFNYEELHNECTECKPGFTSKDGNACQPCVDGTYGVKCLATCRCSQFERCNHIAGCLNLTVSSESNYIPSVSVPDKDRAPDASGETGITAILHGHWIIISTCTFVAGIIVSFGVSCFVLLYKRKTTGYLKTANVNIPEDRTEHVHNMYDEIDETIMEDIKLFSMPDNNSYFSVIEDSNNSFVRSPSDAEDDDIYLHPVNDVVCEDKDETYRKSGKSETMNAESDSSSDTEYQHNGNYRYVTQYQPLQDSWQNQSHQYETQVTIHVNPASSSDLVAVNEENGDRTEQKKSPKDKSDYRVEKIMPNETHFETISTQEENQRRAPSLCEQIIDIPMNSAPVNNNEDKNETTIQISNEYSEPIDMLQSNENTYLC